MKKMLRSKSQAGALEIKRQGQNAQGINYLWSSLIIEELIRCGIDYFCIAPGSRSTPLTVAAARHPKARCHVHFDERGLAFHALGFASSARKPAVLICTSGTAGANFFPAVIESFKKKVPLIVLTADRPPELRSTGAVQTIDQPGLFGKYVKFHFDMPCPDRAIAPECVLTTIDQLVYQAMKNPAGPVHLNCMFREPLVPAPSKEKFTTYLQGISRWLNDQKPYTRYHAAHMTLNSHQAHDLAGQIALFKHPLIVVGKIADQDIKPVLAFIHQLNAPVFADASSGLRFGQSDKNIIHYFDRILCSKTFAQSLTFDGVIHLGGRLTSRRYYEFMRLVNPRGYIMVLNHPLRNDPNHQVSLRVETSVADFCLAVTPLLKHRTSDAQLRQLIKANQSVDQAIQTFINDSESLSEPAVARGISQQIPAGHGLFLASSMPVREMEFFGDYKGNPVRVLGNRGASGIDGLVASALGCAAGLNMPVTFLTGDLALLHDLNSLAMVGASKLPLIIIVVNNNGGAIFSFLPVAGQKDIFEKFFAAAHGFSFEQAGRMFHLDYAAPESLEDFISVYRKAVTGTVPCLIEIKTNRDQNVRVHEALDKTIVKYLQAVL